MINYVDDLKPKVNKLLSLVTDLQQSYPEKIIELGLSFEELLQKARFPAPIQHFFTLPTFQELLLNLKSGRWIPESVFEKKDNEAHPPLEIQTIQRLVEAFHKLVHLDYSQIPVDDPVTQAKILTTNIFDYLLSLDLFLSYKEKSIETILHFLFQSIQTFSQEFTQLLQDNGHIFSKKALELLNSPIFAQLTQLNEEQCNSQLIAEWYPILTELNINPELAQYRTKMTALASANAHKIINQLQTLLGKKSLFYQKTLPTYIPYDIKKEFFSWLDSFTESGELTGQKVNEFFTTKFWQGKYAVIYAKQSANNHKFQHLTHQLWPLKGSLFSLIQQYGFCLPKAFNSYLVDVQPFSLGLHVLGKPNHLAVQLILGFTAIQNDYLSELLQEGVENPLKDAVKDLLYEILPTIFSFFEIYYKMSPTSSFHTIKHCLENLYAGEEAVKIYTLKEIKKRASDTFELLLPIENFSQDTAAAFLYKIIDRLQQLLNLLPSRTPLSRLLSETLRKLGKIDFPSYSQTWYLFGETIGTLFILLSRFEAVSSDKIRSYLDRCGSYPFLKIMFY